MLPSLALLLLFQLAGELVVRGLGLPLPGPVVGLVLLLVVLMARGGVPAALERTADGVLGHLSLMFVPAGVGVVVHLHRIGDQGLAIVAALIGSTLLAIAVTGLMLRRRGPAEEDR